MKEKSGEQRQFEEKYEEYQALAEELSKATEAEYVELLQQDLSSCGAQLGPLYDSMIAAMVPADDDEDKRQVVLEVRGGAGGSEANLFAAELFEMYHKYAQRKRWQWETVQQANDLVAMVKGEGVFQDLRHEVGVHRVQRVPETESLGRLHTSTATVAVLPEAKDVDVNMQLKDLRIDVCKSQGAGGQHVNTTDSAVRITHLPTGLQVFIQDDRSQHKNKARAMEILRARLYEQERRKIDSERESERSKQVGGGQRHERIRTYNWPSSRIKDHRTNFIVNDLHGMMSGGPALDDLFDNLKEWHTIERKKQFVRTLFPDEN